MFWIANKTIVVHSILSIVGLAWTILISQIALAALIALLWSGAFLLWLEWRNT